MACEWIRHVLKVKEDGIASKNLFLQDDGELKNFFILIRLLLSFLKSNFFGQV